MVYEEVTRQSWSGRIGNSIKGVLVGIILFIVAFPLLFWNEGRAVKRYKTLKEGQAKVVAVAADAVDPANEGQLVHVSARAVTDEDLRDPLFGVSARAIWLNRSVEMYQWEEKTRTDTKKNLGGGTKTVKTYTYGETWSSRAIDSSSFKDPDAPKNPGPLPYPSTSWTAGTVTLGAFTLSPSIVGSLRRSTPVALPDGAAPPSEVANKSRRQADGFYLGASPSSPEIGDVRIRFSAVLPGPVSVVARQTGNTFEPDVAQTGQKLQLVKEGTFSAEEMFASAHSSNRILTWILRLTGCLVMALGIGMVLKPLSVVMDVLPILGSITGGITGFVAFLVAVFFSLITTGVAWLFYRPVLGIGLVVAAVAVLVVVKRMGKPKAASGA